MSEEGKDTWRRRADKLRYGNHICWFCRPFPAKPDPERLIEELL